MNEIQWQIRVNGKHQVWKAKGRAMDTIRAKAQDTRANPNSWKTHLVKKRWDIGLLRALNPRIMMMMTYSLSKIYAVQQLWRHPSIPVSTHTGCDRVERKE